MIEATGRARERILAFGLESTGKSLGLLDIARNLPPDRTTWVIDNDNAWDRMLEDSEWAGVEVREEWYWQGEGSRGKFALDDRYCSEAGTVVLYHADGWDQNIAATREIVARADRDDWLGIDSGGNVWGDVQDWYTERVFDKGIDDYFLQVRIQKEAAKGEKGKKSLGALDGWMDWPVINAQYRKALGTLLTNPPCHLYVTAEQTEVSVEDDRETRGLYGELGVKPKAQKRMGHQMQTVLWMKKGRGGVWKMTTVKDRGGREDVEGLDVTGEGFADWYLRGIAGWQEAGVGVARAREGARGKGDAVAATTRSKGA